MLGGGEGDYRYSLPSLPAVFAIIRRDAWSWNAPNALKHLKDAAHSQGVKLGCMRQVRRIQHALGMLVKNSMSDYIGRYIATHLIDRTVQCLHHKGNTRDFKRGVQPVLHFCYRQMPMFQKWNICINLTASERQRGFIFLALFHQTSNYICHYFCAAFIISEFSL